RPRGARLRPSRRLPRGRRTRRPRRPREAPSPRPLCGPPQSCPRLRSSSSSSSTASRPMSSRTRSRLERPPRSPSWPRTGATAAVNVTCYRGRTRHRSLLPGLARPAFGPKRFFFYNLFESDVTGAPVAVFGRSAGSIDAYAAAVGRWLVTRDGFDFLFYYLPDYDFASHVLGPGATREALTRSDAAIGALIEAAGGPDEFLERYAVIVCSDHGQTPVEPVASLQAAF